MYKIKYKPKAQKFIEGQSLKIKRQLIKKIEDLQKDPRAPGSKLLDSEKNIYRIRTGNYRIIYQVRNKVLLIIVAKVGDRKDVYRNLEYLIKAFQTKIS
jgi:mRNA interferase RelE/StbE